MTEQHRDKEFDKEANRLVLVGLFGMALVAGGVIVVWMYMILKMLRVF